MLTFAEQNLRILMPAVTEQLKCVGWLQAKA